MKMRRAQAMVEYVIATAAIVLVVGVISYFVTAVYRSSERTNALVRSDCP